MANSRRAASGDPQGTGGRGEDTGSGRGRLRKARASASTSRNRSSRRFKAMRSSRSPYSPGRRILPAPGCALAVVRPVQPHEQAAAGGVGDIADQPVAAFAAAVGQIIAAHRLGIAREPVRQVSSGRHRLTPRPGPQPAPAGSVPSRWRGSPAPNCPWARTAAASRR